MKKLNYNSLKINYHWRQSWYPAVPVEAAVVEPMEVTLEEVFNEEGNITSISGDLSLPLVSTSVPASTSISPSAAICNSAVLVEGSVSAST